MAASALYLRLNWLSWASIQLPGPMKGEGTVSQALFVALQARCTLVQVLKSLKLEIDIHGIKSS